MALMYAHLLEPPPTVTDKRPDLPAEIDDVIATAMAKSKEERYETPKQLAAALSRVLGPPAAGQAMDAPATVLAPGTRGHVDRRRRACHGRARARGWRAHGRPGPGARARPERPLRRPPPPEAAAQLPTGPPRSRRPMVLIAALVAGLAVIVGGVALAISMTGGDGTEGRRQRRRARRPDRPIPPRPS